jgi:hypothetical protein
MTNEYKTLRELNVQPGDVVVNNLHGARPVAVDRIEGGDFWSKSMRMSRAPVWRIVSRAADTPKTWGDGGMKLEEGKYYRTADGKKVGPVRIAETHIPDKWALWSFEGKIYEVVGLPREDAFDTEIIAEEVDHYHVFNRSEFRPKLWRDMTPEEKGALLLAEHEGKVIECYFLSGWVECNPEWYEFNAYRVRPEPKRETERVTIVNADGVTIGIGTVVCENGKPDCDSIKMEEL